MDALLFHLINTGTSNTAFDLFFPWWTNVQRTAMFLWIFLPLTLLLTYFTAKWRGLAVLAIGTLLTWVIDKLTGLCFKPIFRRPRPFDAGLDVILRIPKPSHFSFPSSHSLDAFFLATFLAMNFPKLRWLFFTLAFLTAYSRVYCGVHYPGDVAGGAAIGSLLAYLVVRATRFANRFAKLKKREGPPV